MLADCYGRVGSQEQSLDALRQAADNGAGPDEARIDLARALARSGKLDQALTNLTSLAERRPELRLDIARLLIQKTLRQPRDQRNWLAAEQAVQQAQKARPDAVESLTLLRAELLEAEERAEEARALIASAQAKNPRNLPYRLAQAELAGRTGKGASDLADSRPGREGPRDRAPASSWLASPYWSEQGGDRGQDGCRETCRDSSRQLPADAQPGLLERSRKAETSAGRAGPRPASTWSSC